jgi:hypothetical protein
VNYRHVELLFNMLVEYFHDQPPPTERDSRGEWVRVRDGLQGAQHCIRVLTPEEFAEWHRCVELPIQVEYGRRPVAFCNYEGHWWAIYHDTEESEVIAQFEKCFEGEPDAEAMRQMAADTIGSSATELSQFFGMTIYMPNRASPPPHFIVTHDAEKAWFEISPCRLLEGSLAPRGAAMVAEWAAAHEKELLAAWNELAAGREPKRIEPLR